MYKLTFYVPTESKEPVKDALFAVGAGRLGTYGNCCFETEGNGQFLPLEGSNPTIGERGQVETVRETRVELLCGDTLIKGVVQALKESHPYEEVAYDVVRIEDI